MNLSAYDNIKEKIDKNKTWINIKKKTLLSREIKYRPYYTLLKRYNPKSNTNSYFIALLDGIVFDKKCKHTNKDDYGRIKINLSEIWNESWLSQLESDCNIMIEVEQNENDGDVYLLDI